MQCLDHMGHGVQTHHVGGAERSAAGTAQLFAGQVVHHVKGQAEIFHFLHGGQHTGNSNPVGDEVGRVFGTHHALAQGTGHKGFQIIQDLRLRGGCIDQLHQSHIAGWVEEMNAAKTGL